MKRLLLTTLTVFAISSANAADLLGAGHNWNNGSVDACKAAVAAAGAENKKAKKMDVEWRDTGKMMKAATKAGGAKCIALANAAKKQATDAQQQGRDQANAGPHNHF